MLSRLGAGDPSAVFGELAARAAADLGLELGSPGVTVERSADVRFAGQAHDLTVPWSDSPDELAARFFAKYKQVYGIAQRGPVEVVSYRVRLTQRAAAPPSVPPSVPPSARDDAGAGPGGRTGGEGRARLAWFPESGGFTTTPVLTRDHLRGAPGRATYGPAIIEDAEATIVVPPGWTAALSPAGAVILERGR